MCVNHMCVFPCVCAFLFGVFMGFSSAQMVEFVSPAFTWTLFILFVYFVQCRYVRFVLFYFDLFYSLGDCLFSFLLEYENLLLCFHGQNL